MTTQTDGEAILKEMVDGLKAVSEGPWESDWDGTKNDTEGHYASYKLMDGSGYTIADALNATATDIIAECSADGHVIDRLAAANFEHFARCDPENIRAIAAYASTLKSERDAALERVSVLEKALTKIANARTPRMSKSIGEERCGAIASEALKGTTHD